MISVKVRHFSPTLDPNLVLAVLSQVIEAGYVESELAAFGELAD